MKIITTLLTLITCSLTLSTASAGEEVIKDSQGMDCYVYTPNKIDTDKTYQLVVGVHGYRGNGKGAGGKSSWAKKFDCIVIGPSFNDGYQGAPARDVKKLLKLVKEIGKKYKIHDKFFIVGHSGGAQFAHRFAMAEPRVLNGCCATSAGSWATEGGIFGSISGSAKKVPFYIGCGDKDTSLSVPNYPYNRLDWYRKFASQLEKRKFKVVKKEFKGKGHGLGAAGVAFAEQAYKECVLDNPAANPKKNDAPRKKSIAGRSITPLRTWTSANGKKIKAKLLAMGGTKDKPICIKDGKITLLKRGRTFKIDLDQLSEKDQAFIKQLNTEPAESPANP